MEFKSTTASSIEFANENKLEEWVHLFLCSEGNNKPFSDGLKLEPRFFHSPQIIDLEIFNRCCGPEKGIKHQIPSNDFFTNVNNIILRYQSGDWDMPPLIVNYENGIYELNDGNHRYEALKKLNINKYWVII